MELVEGKPVKNCIKIMKLDDDYSKPAQQVIADGGQNFQFRTLDIHLQKKVPFVFPSKLLAVKIIQG